MPPPKKLSLALPPSVRTRLESLASDAGVTVEDYATTLLSGHAIGGGNPSAGARRGRPITVQPDDLPADIERTHNATGFAGVVRVGRLFVARAAKQPLGRYSTAELAAIVRYHELHGFRVGRGQAFHEAGLPVDVAVDLALRAGFGAPTPSTLPTPPAPPAPSGARCTVCQDSGKMPIRGVAGGVGRWWPCECPAGVDVEKPEGWDATGRAIEEQG